MRLKEIFNKAKNKIMTNKVVQKIKEKTIDPVQRAYLTWRMLEACDINAFEDVPELVERGANIHAADEMALGQAARGCFSVVKLLVEKGADVRAAGDRALRTAAAHGQLEIVQYLHEKGADLNSGDGEALMFAAKHGYPDVVEYLLENGVTINSVEDWPYRSAVYGEHKDVIACFDAFLKGCDNKQVPTKKNTQRPPKP